MTKTEILEFLELPENSGDQLIEERLYDKFSYFERLSKAAPNAFLQKLHNQNIEKVKSIQQLLGYTSRPFNSAHRQGNIKTPPSDIPLIQDSSKKGGDNPVAWLIRHTENLATKSYPVYLGENIIGRAEYPGKPTILLNDDNYVSRLHAVLFAEQNYFGASFYIDDSPSSNGGKASKNGTYVNSGEKRVVSKTKLDENYTIQAGMTKLILRLNNTPLKKMVSEVEESDFMKTVVINIL